MPTSLVSYSDLRSHRCHACDSDGSDVTARPRSVRRKPTHAPSAWQHHSMIQAGTVKVIGICSDISCLIEPMPFSLFHDRRSSRQVCLSCGGFWLDELRSVSNFTYKTTAQRHLHRKTFHDALCNNTKELTQAHGIKNNCLDRVLTTWSRSPLPTDIPYGVPYLLPQCEGLLSTGSVTGIVSYCHPLNQRPEKFEIGERLYNP